MKTPAAVLVETGEPLQLMDLEIPVLRAGQVLVEMAFSGVCHTQLLECRGYRGKDAYLPHCLGHEGSGRVVEVGPEVERCRHGDLVVLSWIRASGCDVPGSVYASDIGPVNAGGVTTFSRFTVVSENRVNRLRQSTFPLPLAALLGCAAPTGVGAIWNTAAVQSGQSVAVFGVGGVGLCAVAAAAQRGAKPLIAIDLNPERLYIAKELGATHLIDASDADPLARLREICPSGVDHAIEASGRPAVMRLSLESVRARGGNAVIIGNARFGEELSFNPQQLNQGKRLLGAWGGDCDPDRDLPLLEKAVAEGGLRLEPLVGKTYPLSQVNEALEDLERGATARPLLDLRESTTQPASD